MEEQLANGNGSAESIQEAKVALIGPTSAIGDSRVAPLSPLLLTICLSIASAIPGSAWVGALLYMIIYPLGTYLLSWKLFNLGYKAGLDGVQRFMASGELDRIMQAITVPRPDRCRRSDCKLRHLQSQHRHQDRSTGVRFRFRYIC